MEMPQARDQASQTPNQRPCKAKGGKEGRWPPGHSRTRRPLPSWARRKARVGGRAIPVRGPRAQAVPSTGWRYLSPRSPGAPRLPLPPHPQPKAGKTRNLGSGAEATDQVTARVGGSGRNSVGHRGWRRGRQSPGGRGSSRTALGSEYRARIPSLLTDPQHLWVLTVPGPLA